MITIICPNEFMYAIADAEAIDIQYRQGGVDQISLSKADPAEDDGVGEVLAVHYKPPPNTLIFRGNVVPEIKPPPETIPR